MSKGNKKITEECKEKAIEILIQAYNEVQHGEGIKTKTN